jgi:outer membrane protein
MRLSFILISFIFCFTSQAQEKWNLKSCVEYAMAHNFAVSQSDIQSNISGLTYKQSKLAMYPGLNLNTNTAYNSGNNQDPTTFTRVTQNYLSAGLQLQSSAEVFNFFSKKNAIAANEWELMAAKANVNKVKNDIALSTANAFLQVLLSKEQEKIVLVQIQQTQAQLSNVKKMVVVGTLPELNATQLEAQLASDSSSYISALGNTQQALLSLKSLMSIDAAQFFEIETPPVASIPVESIADLQPDYVYAEALKNQPQQLFDEYRLKAAQYNIKSAKAAMLPTFSAFGSLGSNYLSFTKRALYNKQLVGYESTGLLANAGNGVFYDVQSPVFSNGNVIGYLKPSSFSSQLSDNFRKSIGLNISIPIFNGGNTKIAYQKSILNSQLLQTQKDQNSFKLKQDIYQAFNACVIALQKLNAGSKLLEASEMAYNYANKRFNIGALGTFDLITTQNNLLKVKLEYSINQFDFVFKMKVLEFYKGAGLKL